MRRRPAGLFFRLPEEGWQLFVDVGCCYAPPQPVYPSSAMAPTRSSEELDRAVARARRKRRRRALIRDAVLALTIALILFGARKAIAIAFAS